MSELLEVRDLVKRFGATRAVDGVSFAIGAGETLGLVGESGSGKTTAGRCVLRLIEPTSGEVRFEGADVRRLRGRELRALRRRMQIVFQDPVSSLNPRLRAGSTVAEPLVVHGVARGRDARDRVRNLLGLVGLRAADADCLPHELSGGQRQRVCIARALALDPKLIVADEPVSALDVSVQAQIVNLMRDLQERLGVAYLFISHDLSVVRHVAGRTAVMYLGRLVEIGATERLFAQPAHPYTQLLLSAVPVPDPGRRRPRGAGTGEVAASHRVPTGCRFHPRCPQAMDVCSEVDPEPRPCGEGHTAACHL